MSQQNADQALYQAHAQIWQSLTQGEKWLSVEVKRGTI